LKPKEINPSSEIPTEQEFDKLLISVYNDKAQEQKQKILNFFLVEKYDDLNDSQKLFIKEKLMEKIEKLR
jgi:hypothetical protein